MSRFTSIKIILQIAVVGAILIWFHSWSQKTPAVKVNQEDWDYLLKKHVKGGSVDFDRLDGDIKEFYGYLLQLPYARYPSDTLQEEVVVFWINAHNAITVWQDLLNRKPWRQRVATYPVSKNGRFSVGGKWYTLDKLKSHDSPLPIYAPGPGGKRYTLDELESHVLEVSNEPRVFFALYDGDAGVRTLRAEAYTAEKLNQQLEEQTVEFFSQNGNVYIDYKNNVLHLPSALAEIVPYIEKQTGSVGAFVARYSPREISEHIRTKKPRVVFGK